MVHRNVEAKIYNESTALSIILAIYDFIYDKDTDEMSNDILADELQHIAIKAAMRNSFDDTTTALHELIWEYTYTRYYIYYYEKSHKYVGTDEDFLEWALDLMIESGADKNNIPSYFWQQFDHECPNNSDDDYEIFCESIALHHDDLVNANFFIDCLKGFVDQVFVYFWNRPDILLDFNIKMSNVIKDLTVKEYPPLLKDGQVKRIYMQVWLEDLIMARERGRCYYCKKTVILTDSYNRDIHFDHLIPIAHGGSNDPTNFVLSCSSCNSKKGTEIWAPQFTHYWPKRF